MLVLEAFGNRRFSIAMTAVALAVFALMGAHRSKTRRFTQTLMSGWPSGSWTIPW
jgi:hypothetical protein